MFTALKNNYFTNRKVCQDWGQGPWKWSPATDMIHVGIKSALRIQLQDWDHREAPLQFKSLWVRQLFQLTWF